MDRICRICFSVSGMVAPRTIMVNRMMAMPIWLKLITYNTIRVLSMGLIISSVHRTKKTSKKPYLLLPLVKGVKQISILRWSHCCSTTSRPNPTGWCRRPSGLSGPRCYPWYPRIMCSR